MNFRPHIASALAAAAVASLAACSGQELASQPNPSEPLEELVGMPEGFSPTADGAIKSFGQRADIVTTGFDSGLPVYWEVTVDAPRTLTQDEVAGNIGQDPGKIGLPTETESATSPAPKPERYRQFSCFTVTLTPLAVGTTSGDAPISAPGLHPIDPGGLKANYVEHGDNAYCGMADEDPVPTYSGDIEVGRDYKQAVVTWAGADDPGIVGTGVELNTVVSPANSAQPAQTVRWQ